MAGKGQPTEPFIIPAFRPVILFGKPITRPGIGTAAVTPNQFASPLREASPIKQKSFTLLWALLLDQARRPQGGNRLPVVMSKRNFKEYFAESFVLDTIDDKMNELGDDWKKIIGRLLK